MSPIYRLANYIKTSDAVELNGTLYQQVDIKFYDDSRPIINFYEETSTKMICEEDIGKQCYWDDEEEHLVVGDYTIKAFILVPRSEINPLKPY